jgi:transposase
MSRPYKTLELTAEQQRELQKIANAYSTPANLLLRVQIILLSHAGKVSDTVATTLNVSKPTIYKWKNRFIEKGLDGLKDGPRSGQPRKLSQETVKSILDMTVHEKPEGMTHWSLSRMAKHAGVSRWQVQEIWKASDLKPHRIQGFKISQDPLFAEKVVDVVGLYLNPPDNALVLSVDEKTQIQALNRTQPLLPMRPGQVERRTHDYKRHGTTNLYAAYDLSTGHVIQQLSEKHRAVEFIAFLNTIHKNTPPALNLHIILDNSSTHKTQAVKEWLDKHPRFTLHFTPTSASWLNAVESWFARLERQALYRGVFVSVAELEQAINAYVKVNNQEHKPFSWKKSAEAILQTQQQLNKRTNKIVH